MKMKAHNGPKPMGSVTSSSEREVYRNSTSKNKMKAMQLKPKTNR